MLVMHIHACFCKLAVPSFPYRSTVSLVSLLRILFKSQKHLNRDPNSCHLFLRSKVSSKGFQVLLRFHRSQLKPSPHLIIQPEGKLLSAGRALRRIKKQTWHSSTSLKLAAIFRNVILINNVHIGFFNSVPVY